MPVTLYATNQFWHHYRKKNGGISKEVPPFVLLVYGLMRGRVPRGQGIFVSVDLGWR